MNAQAPIGASKLKIFACLLNYYIKAIDHKLLWFRGMINHLGCLQNTRRIRKSLACRS